MEYFTWNVNPEALRLGSIAIRWYGLFFALSFYIGLHLMQWMRRKEGIEKLNEDALLAYIILGTILGARLGHCFFYAPDHYFSKPLDIIRIWDGGLASHGGAIGILLAITLYCWKYKGVSFLWLADRLSIVVLIGCTFIRVGNFFNAEIVGHTTSVPWAVRFIQFKPDNLPRHPAQLYEAIAYFLLFIIIFTLYKKTSIKDYGGRIIGLSFIGIFASRLFLEQFKIQQAHYAIDGPLKTGQWLSIPFIIAGIILLFISKKQNISEVKK